MTEAKCFRDAFRDQLHELSGQPNTVGFTLSDPTHSAWQLVLNCS